MKKTRILLFLVSTILSCFICCEPPSQPIDSTMVKCNELAGTVSSPITIGKILCAAKDSLGNLYIVDESQNRFRVFISNGNTLFRKNVLGSAIIAERFYFLTIEGGIELVFQNLDDDWSDVFILEGNCQECDSLLMGHFAPGDRNLSYFIAGWSDVCQYLKFERANSLQLAIATSNEVNSYELKNFPPTTHVEYLAQQQSGQYLLATRPYYDWSGDIVLHYGLPDEMKKRQVVRFLRASDGGSTWITFVAESDTCEAFFGVDLGATGLSYGRSWVRIGMDTLNLERKNANSQALSELGFDCSVTFQ